MLIHFKDSDDLIHEGDDMDAVCGAKVLRVVFVYLEDLELVVNAMDFGSFRSACRECLKVPLEKRRRYAICNGQEYLDQKSSHG